MSSAVALVVVKSCRSGAPNVKTVDLPRPPVAVPLDREGPLGRQIWVVGIPTAPTGDLDRILDDAVTGDLASATRALASLDGAFAAFIWDPAQRRFVVVTDFAGFQPLYMRRAADSLMFAPRIDALGGGAPPDPAGWGAFVGFGHFVGERTSATGVVRLGPATILEYEPDADRLTTSTYWKWPDVDSRLTAARVDTGELLELLEASIDAYAPYGVEGTLLLSGGYESRLLAGLLARAGRRPTALTLRNPYEHLEIDGRFAARVACVLDIPHVLRDSVPGFFSTDKYLEYVRLSEVGTTSVNLFIAQVLSELQASGARASWDGVSYGVVIKDKSEPSFDAFVRRAMKPADSAPWRAARRVFAPAFVDAMWTELQSTLAEEIARCHVGPAGVAEFFVRNRARNRTTPNMLKVYANFIIPLMPGLTKAFYEKVVPIPTALKAHDALYRRIIGRHFPALARLPFCSGGELVAGTSKDLGYRLLAARSAVVEHPRIGDLLRRVGLTPARPRSTAVDTALASANLDDECLNGDGIRALQRTRPTGANNDTFARELVFYWSMWRELVGRAGGCRHLADDMAATAV